jgi:hypothetical protein
MNVGALENRKDEKIRSPTFIDSYVKQLPNRCPGLSSHL